MSITTHLSYLNESYLYSYEVQKIMAYLQQLETPLNSVKHHKRLHASIQPI